MELTKLKGIGESRKKAFENNDIFSVEDLINYFPYKYYDFSKTEPFCADGKVRLIKATVTDSPKLVRATKILSFVSSRMIDEKGHNFTAIWYNQTYVKSQIYIGANLYLYGKNSPTKKDTFVVNLFKFQDKFDNQKLLPVYHTVSGVGQKTISDSIFQSLEMLNISSFIPDYLLQKYNLCDLSFAFKQIHFPSSTEDVYASKDRIEIENLVAALSYNEINKLKSHETRIYNYENITKYTAEFESILPYNLTDDQKKAISDISLDFSSKLTMNRLLQGDVGSGKTVISLFGAFIAARNGYQSVIVAPTEILASQHYLTASNLFANSNIRVIKLTSQAKGKERADLLHKIESGEADIIISTHSILSSDVDFKNLSFIVIDEQHRFGVEQRAIIKQKSKSADVLVMSATPIPRSLALVIYGSLDISTISKCPKNHDISTHLVIKSKQNDMWLYLKNMCEKGSKLYVVCSKIDEENEDDNIVKFSAKNTYDFLLQYFDKNDIALIHGKLKKETQNSIIEKFKMGKIKVLVSTTIVEVGVDIPDADLMVIATPERFGLATLHQLRGRIGRNGEKAHCFCLVNNLSQNSIERINYFKSNSNGFEIAEFDLKTRGAGTMMGISQHGVDSSLISNFSAELLNKSKSILEDIKNDEQLFLKAQNLGSKLLGETHIEKIVFN